MRAPFLKVDNGIFGHLFNSCIYTSKSGQLDMDHTVSTEKRRVIELILKVIFW